MAADHRQALRRTQAVEGTAAAADAVAVTFANGGLEAEAAHRPVRVHA